MLRKLGKFFTNRIAIFAILTLLLIGFFAFALLYLNYLSNVFYFACLIFSIFAAFEILSRDTYPEYKMAWVLVVCALPFFGIAFYFVLGRKNISKQKQLKYMSAIKDARNFLSKSANLEKDEVVQNCEKIIYSHCKMPAYAAKSIHYYNSGAKFYHELIKTISSAKDYIFLEYYIIKPGAVWNKLFEILKDKAKNGVDVRIIYDDLGSVLNLPRNFPNVMKKHKIKVVRFNRIVPLFDARMNIRNHRKTAIVDGKAAFVSGANISDEYANITCNLGHWKDFGAKVTGMAVNSFVVSFLDSWQKESKVQNPSILFSPIKATKSKKIVIPFQDSPFFKSSVYEDVLLNLIYSAKHEIKITTPYLVPTGQIQAALISACRRGVSVSICLPGTPDKKSIFEMTKAFALSLAQHGIKIYFYSPGFLHSKLFVVDNKYAVVGTSNLDLRSMHSNCEINMFVCDFTFVCNVNEDISNIIKNSNLLSPAKKPNIFIRAYRSFVRLFSPLM